ncbi:hypothetical protein [Pseudomonas sp. BIGb0164]|uniref:hypothetical protein n=1 Tax=Pseudomonas sp. BIGb0164 TaxID=2940605 RepID=UPI00216912CB|nr:hypothetical protein [Pseudomonas sp. BIGb0164]MCS4250508.1 hypothetical protein [Pseudomonas sp. BIGb0164]
MQVINDNRPEYILRLEHLLYGYNYMVSVDSYGPLSTEQPLIEALKQTVSSSCEVTRSAPISAEGARALMLESFFFVGDSGGGPIDLPDKREEIIGLVEQLTQGVHLHQADAIHEFYLAKGHPGYPVWWEFALDIHAQGQRWILLGSSSD